MHIVDSPFVVCAKMQKKLQFANVQSHKISGIKQKNFLHTSILVTILHAECHTWILSWQRRQYYENHILLAFKFCIYKHQEKPLNMYTMLQKIKSIYKKEKFISLANPGRFERKWNKIIPLFRVFYYYHFSANISICFWSSSSVQYILDSNAII